MIPSRSIHPQRWASLPILLAGAIIPVIDVFAISMILPTIRASLGASAADAQFIVSVFSGVYAVFLITGSRLGDLWGRRKLFIVGGVAFAFASMVAALAPSAGFLIAARGLQGLAASLFAPQVLASIQAGFETEERPVAIRWLGTAFAVAGVSGFLWGGALIAWHPFGLTWQAYFWSFVPWSLAVAVGGLFVPESRNTHAQGLDPRGVALLFLSLGLVVFPLAEGRAAGWPWWSLVLLALSPVLWVTFFRTQARLFRRGGSPLVSVDLFRDWSFVRGLILSLILYVSYGFLVFFAFYLKAVKGWSAWDLGLASVPFGAAFFVTSFLVGPLTRVLGQRILATGFGTMALGMAIMSLSIVGGGQGVDGWGVAGLAVMGAANGLLLPSLIRVVTTGMDPRHAGLAAGILLSVQQMGAALGYVLLGGIFFSTLNAGGSSARAFLGVLVADMVLTAVAVGLAATMGTQAKLPRTLPSPARDTPCREAGACEE